jgi:hypothetical protein
MNTRQEVTDTPGMQQQNKELRFKGAATSEERGHIWQDLQENHRAGDRKVNS